MRWKTLPVNGLISTLLILLLGCGSLPGWSQEEPEPTTDSSSETAQSPGDAVKADKPTPDPIDESSPFDYQASEEISQDLSVSYPVDI